MCEPRRTRTGVAPRDAFAKLGQARVAAAILSVLLIAGCSRLVPVDTRPLDQAGFSYDSIQQLNTLKISPPEIAEIVKAHQGGMSEMGCLQVVGIYRRRGEKFDAGDSVAGLLKAGVGESTVLGLANINQLGIGAGEFEVMRLAGLSDAILLQEAQNRVAGKNALSGASLARLKNWGVSEATLLELVRRAVPDSEADQIIAARRKGARDSEILRRFAAS